MYNGGGGFTHTDVWTMPIPLRRFHINKINERIEDQQKELDEKSGKETLSKENNPIKQMPKEAKQALQKDIEKNKAKQSKKPTYTTNVKLGK